MSESIRGRHWGSDSALRQAHKITRRKGKTGEAVGIRLTHDSEYEYCLGSNYDMLPNGARKLVVDDDHPSTADFNLSFRIARDT